MSTTGPALDVRFAGSIPRLYQEYLVPLIFEPYAADLLTRVTARPASRILELAAGTGVVTRRLATSLPESVAIVATDLNQAMLDCASSVGTTRPVEWRQADAMQLPFADRTFDTVVCQFGVMFFPDKGKAFAEARRVLRPGGTFIFNVWDRLEENAFAATVTAALKSYFPADPPEFMSRTPHGYHDHELIKADLARGGFTSPPRIDTVPARSRGASAQAVALAYCQGTPLRNEIESRDPAGLQMATDHAARLLVERFGAGEVEGKIQALVIEAEVAADGGR